MTICPIALAVGCKKCPIFKVCPLTSVLGDQGKNSATQTPETNSESLAQEQDAS